MSTQTLTPALQVAVAAIPPKTVASTLTMAPIPMYWVTVSACTLDEGEPAWIRSERFQIQQVSPTRTIVNGEQFDEHGFTLCGCLEWTGSEWCCGMNRDFDQVLSFMRHWRRVFGRSEQMEPAEIVEQCPVNVFARGPVAA